MKKSQPLVDKSKELTIHIRGTKYKCASEEALIQYLVEFTYFKSILRGLLSGYYTWFTSIKKADGNYLSVSNIYWKAKENLDKKKKCQQPPIARPNSHQYGRVRGYLFAAKENDPMFLDEPKGKYIEERGFYFYEEDWLCKTQKNWKKFRKHQYK